MCLFLVVVVLVDRLVLGHIPVVVVVQVGLFKKPYTYQRMRQSLSVLVEQVL